MTTVETNGTKPKPAATAATTPAATAAPKAPPPKLSRPAAVKRIGNILARVEVQDVAKVLAAAQATYGE